jgi:predicted metal-dependent peptidase
MEGGYIHFIMNRAMDHVINLYLLERGFDVPNWMCCDRRFKGMHTMEVYAILLKEYEDGKADLENLLDDLRLSPVPQEEAEQHITDLIMLGQTQVELAGQDMKQIPGDIQVFLKKLLEPKLPWWIILQRYMKALGKNDYSTRKPNKRYLPGYYLPSLYSENVMDLTFGIDISGSAVPHLTQFVSDIDKVLHVMRPKKITLILFDACIVSIHEVKNIKELLDIKFRGGGSTNPREVFDWAEENKTDLLLMFTDGFFQWHALKPNTKVNTVWLINDNPRFTATFGKIIHFET